jgi:hypothetical protein
MIYWICFVDKNVGYGAGYNLKMIKTIDGGVHWVQQDIETNTGLAYYYHLWGVTFTDQIHGWAVGSNGITGRDGIIICTTNGGTTWELQATRSEGLQSIHFCSSTTGWAVGQDGTILGTTDGGSHWQDQSSNTDYMLYSVCAVNPMSCWIAGQGGLILHSTDGGASWERQSNPATQTLFSVFFLDESLGWTVGGGGTILNTASGGVLPVQEPPHPKEPGGYCLSQNYPNPFNPTTKIQFTIVNRQLTIVKVYDVLGREVATVVNEVKKPGTYTVAFNASSLASGVYVCRLQAGDFVQSRRVLLLK